jgi:ATP adenylyltransferase
MDHLWAPWRLSYVLNEKPPPGREPPCFLCQALREEEDRRNLLVWRTPRSMVVLNRFPYNNGHVLVAPHGHQAKLDELAEEDHVDLSKTTRTMVRVLEKILTPQGFNIGLNIGHAAGAGLPGHLHWHVVPRWSGDTNFISTLADTRVIVQSLDTLFGLLAEHLPPSTNSQSSAP